MISIFKRNNLPDKLFDSSGEDDGATRRYKRLQQCQRGVQNM